MAAADRPRQHITREERRFNLRMNDGVHSMNVGYEANDHRQAINCDRSAKQHVRSQRASDKRKKVAQGATTGFFAGSLVGGGAGAGAGAAIGAVIGSIIPGPGTLIGAAVGATIGGIAGAGAVGGTGVAVGAGVAAALPDEKDDHDD